MLGDLREFVQHREVALADDVVRAELFLEGGEVEQVLRGERSP